MTDNFSTTLAYSKSPKATRRTTFQDELEAAVSARSTKKPDPYSYSDDFDDDGDEDDAFKRLLNSRKMRRDAFKAGKSKSKINDFMLSDEEEENERPKRVSFMKTRKLSTSPLQDVPRDTHSNAQTDSSVGDGTLPPQLPESPQRDDGERTTPEKHERDSPLSSTVRKSPTESTFDAALEKSLRDSPSSLPSDGALVETPTALISETSEESKTSAVGIERTASPQALERDVMNMSLTDSVPESEPPRPKPRQRSLKTSSPRAEERPEDDVPPPSRPPTAPSPIPQTDQATATSPTANVSTASSHSPQGVQEEYSTSSKVTTPPSPAASQQGPQDDCSPSPRGTRPSSPAGDASQQSQALSKTTDDSWSRDGHVSEDGKDYEGKFSSSEFQEDPVDRPDPSVSRLSHVSEKSAHTRPPCSPAKGSQRSRSACTYAAESRYLGTLKLLDRKVTLQGSEPGAADDLRSTIYQEWLKKKQEKLQETMRLRTREERLKEEKRIMEEQTKKQDSMASYTAWKEKKSDAIKAKVKQEHEAIRKKEREEKEKEEKKESAKKVFERWKQEHDGLLREKYRKQKQAENKLRRKTEEKKEERKRDCTSAFSHWDEKKKGVVTEKVKTERRTQKIKEEEERYEKQERDRVALEMYEKWLQRKERQQKRQRKEERIQAILQDDPPPPWSPPNKTIPFGK